MNVCVFYAILHYECDFLFRTGYADHARSGMGFIISCRERDERERENEKELKHGGSIEIILGALWGSYGRPVIITAKWARLNGRRQSTTRIYACLDFHGKRWNTGAALH